MEVFRNWDQTSNLSNNDLIFNTVRDKRNLTCIPHKPPMEKICTSGVVPYLHRVLQQLDDYLQLQFESTWALTNMTSSTSNTVVSSVAEFPGMVHELGRLVVFGKTADLRF